MCPTPKVLDEVTQRCVYLEDCKRPGVLPPPPDSDSFKSPGCSWEEGLRVPGPRAAESAQSSGRKEPQSWRGFVRPSLQEKEKGGVEVLLGVLC